MNMQFLILIGGVLHFGILLASAAVPQVLDWPKELAKLDRLDWLDQQCRAQIEAGSIGFAPPDENDWRIGRRRRLV